MEENKNINPETELETTEIQAGTENFDIAEAVKGDKKSKKEKKAKKPRKQKLLKNQALLKRGSFSVAITAAVVAGVIVFNFLVGALSDRFVLEFDMSAEKVNSISEENIEFIKDVEDEVTITMCADAESYVGGYMAYYAQQYSVTEDATGYYDQTLKLLDKYDNYNKNIKVEYIDVQSSEFAALASKYPNETISYGDIVVSATKNGNERHRIVGFKDIYQLKEDNTYASYGYTVCTVSGNNVETAVTSAIAYVTSTETKKLAVLTGHSKADYTADYQTMLKTNNYEMTVIDNAVITELSDDFDAVVIAGPTTDFIGSELDVIAEFLDNDGKLGKGLIFFADATAPYLTNLYDFLLQWGISIDEGVLYETNSSNHMADDPTTIGLYSSGADELTENTEVCITGYNVPMTAAFENEGAIAVKSLINSLETTVIAPVGTGAGWTEAGKQTAQVYSGLLQAVKSDYDDDNNLIASYVMAFGSIEYIYSEYYEYTSVSNKDLSLAVAERAVGAEDVGIQFVSKTITEESFADRVTEASANVIRIIFMVMLPIILIVAGVVIYVKRRNA